MYWFILFWSFVLGAVVGSFLNVVVYRLPLGKSIAHPRSHCPNCKHILSPLELVPIVSFLFLKGKCRQCHIKIAWRYPAVEFLTGLLFSLGALQWGISIQSGIYLLFTSLLISLALIDLDTRRIPNTLTYGIGLLALAQLLLGTFGVLPEALSLKGMLWGAAIGALPLLILLIVGQLLNVQVMGMGDFKLMLFSGLLIGPIVAFYSLLIAFVLGGLGALWALLIQRRGLKAQIAFGPYLAMGLYFSLLYSTYFYLY